jgi:acyl-CoA dehydrogenase
MADSVRNATACLDGGTSRRPQHRVTFGKPIIQHQVIRHKLVDVAERIEASQAMLELLTRRVEGRNPVAEICMLRSDFDDQDASMFGAEKHDRRVRDVGGRSPR